MLNSNSEQSVLNLVYQFHYHYFRKKNYPILLAVLAANMYLDFPFLILLLILFYCFDKFLHIGFPFEAFGKLGFLGVAFLVALPLGVVVNLFVCDRKTLEATPMTDKDYKKARNLYVLAMAFLVMILITLPVLFGGA